MKNLAAGLMLCAGLVLCGCPSISTMSSARTMAKGKFQIGISPGLYGVATTGSSSSGSATAPQLEVAGRVGITDSVEIGAKAWFLGVSIDGKFAILRPQDPMSGLNLSVNPGVGYFSFSGATGSGSAGLTVVTFYLPALVGYRFAGHEVTVGPKLVDQVWLASGGSSTAAVNVLYLGTSLGFGFKIGDSFRILPEASLLYPAVGSSPSGTSALGASGVLFQIGVGFLFGGQEQAPTPEPAPAQAAPPVEAPPSAPPPPPPGV